MSGCLEDTDVVVLAGGLVLFATINYAPNLVLWTLPIALPLVAAPVLISATGNPALGDWVRRQRLFETPFESDPEPVIRSYALWQERLARLSAGADLEKATVSVAPVLPDPA